MRRRTCATALLVVAIASVGCGFPEPDTPLARAAMQGDIPAVQGLLAKGADPNEPEGHGLTPLVLAARFGRVEAIEVLIAGGADPELMDNPRRRPAWTPLMNAVHTGQGGAVRALLAAGARVSAAAPDRTTALMLAAPEADTAVLELLLDAGADPRPGEGGSKALTAAVAAGRVENVKALLDRAPDLMLQPGPYGSLARWLARIQGRGEILDLLEKRQGGKGSASHGASPAAAVEVS